MREKITDYPELMKDWDWIKNGEDGLFPYNITVGSSKFPHWKCHKCGYEWNKARVVDRVNGTGCPCCSNRVLVPGVNDLQTVRPDIAAEWHPTKNGDVTPDQIFPGSKGKRYWLCQKCGYEWEAEPQYRTKEKGTGCPCCSGNTLVAGKNDLQTVRPDIAAQWHPELNGDLRPDMYMPCSEESVWWLCDDCGHVWNTKIMNRTKGKNLNDGRGCPECSKHLQTSFPEQAIYYYMKQVFPDTINRYTELGFEIDVYVPSIKLGIEYDGLRSHFEKQMKDEEKNQKCKNLGIQLIRVREQGLNDVEDCCCVIRSVKDKYSMDTVIKRIFKGLGILDFDVDVSRDSIKIRESYKGIVRKNSLAEMYPEIAAEWHPTKNGNLTPYMFSKRTNTRVHWQCKSCGHSWIAAISDRTKKNGTGCPECARVRRIKNIKATYKKKSIPLN